MPDRIDLAYCMKLPPKEAVAYLTSKGYTISWDWEEVWQDAHAKAFTVAKATRLDILQDIRDAVEKALKEGKTLAWFEKELTPVLKAKGWWGRQENVDKETGEITSVQLGSPWRLQTIYRTNLQTAYMAGRFQEQLANADDRPYWQYVAILDSRTRPSHRAMNGKVFRYDDPLWGSFYPPNGWGCRCRVQAVRAPREGAATAAPDGWADPTANGSLPGIDKGWAYAPGASVADELRSFVDTKAAALPTPLGDTFAASMRTLPPAPDLPQGPSQ